mmetsp:Transcript_68/g.136  ORF Transcript_68/g.136 Transcript_68/m.136 type:complete len:272 (-) Transcript_68:892-1707(-)
MAAVNTTTTTNEGSVDDVGAAIFDAGFTKVTVSDDDVPSPTSDGPRPTLWMVRHGERIDETSAAMQWLASTPQSRMFDPPLTEAGAEQAAAAAKTLLGHTRKPAFGNFIYSSPMARCLRTASVVAEATGTSVRVVPGLGACAAAGRRGVMKLDLLSEEEMRELCPQMVAFEIEAPQHFEDACHWVADVRAAEDDNAQDVLVVTHREGIRDLALIHQRLPYCAIARFHPCSRRASPEDEPAWELAELTEPNGASCLEMKKPKKPKKTGFWAF